MIPLRDDQAKHRFTAVNTALIAINIAVFVHEWTLGPGLTRFVDRYAMTPVRLTGPLHAASGTAAPIAGGFVALAPWETPVTSMFLHAGILHLAGNLLYLLIFGAAVEEALGHARFLGFYLASGIVGALAMVAYAPDSHVPVIGASGAIAGVLGAYFVLYPRARILTPLPVFVFLYFFEVPAVVYLLIWFAAQLYWGLAAGSGEAAAVGGVAWWGHIGGFLFGMAAGPMIARGNPRTRRRR